MPKSGGDQPCSLVVNTQEQERKSKKALLNQFG
jgi:hypothetical protein